MSELHRKYGRRNNRKYKNIIINHIQNNLKEYIISSIIFFIGILLGIVFVNNLNDVQTSEIQTYITNSINTLKENNVKEISVLKESLSSNIFLAVSLWLMGSTIIGLLVVYLIVCFKGFCFGYTFSSIIYVLGTNKGILFFISTMFLKNIIVIPCTIALAVSGMNVYKSVMQDRRKENIKLEIIRHTFFSIFILILLVLSSFIEAYISQNILDYCIKYI